MANNTIAVLRQMLASLDDAKKYQSLRDVMSTMNAPDLAAVFEDLPEEKMPVLFRLCPKDLAADVFAELSSETQEALIRGLTDRELKSVVEELCVDDATDLVEEMPASVVKRILAQAEPDTRKMINELLKYPEDSAGGVMTTEFMELAPDWTVRSAMDAIRRMLVRGAPLSAALETATALTDESICRSLWRDTPRRFGVDFEGALPAYIRRVEKIFEA